MQKIIDDYVAGSGIDFLKSPSIDVRNRYSGKEETYLPKWDCEQYALTGINFWQQDPIEKGLDSIVASFLHMMSADIRWEYWSDPRQPVDMQELRQAVTAYIETVKEMMETEESL